MTGFDRIALEETCKAHGRVARVVVAEARGSAPREVGAAMLVWSDGMSGTIGGGELEHQATETARARLTRDDPAISRHALGPDLGQCCGGAVTLLTEVYDLSRVTKLDREVIARGSGDMPISVARLLSDARGKGVAPKSRLLDGWMIEPVARPERAIWIWGAGHVGRAMVDVLHRLPDVHLTWVDTHQHRFPDSVPQTVNVTPASHPALLVKHAPKSAEHLIVTYSHALDLELCNHLLSHGFAFAGLIGSKTKWGRFRSRLMALGHSPASVARITCPIGQPSLGKHPHAIAVGVAAQLLAQPATVKTTLEKSA